MVSKPCRQCGETKPLSEFYRHSAMPDGHLNQCKECKRAYAREYRQNNLERVQAYDRERGSMPHRKAAVKRRAHRYKHKNAEYAARYYSKYPEKYRARNMVNAAIRDGKLKARPCEVCGHAVGIHAHHDDYSKPLEVRWLCPKHHGERHRELNEMKRRAA